MKVKHFIKEKIIVFEMTEEIDHHACDSLRRRIDYEIERFLPKRVIFDFNHVLFMDSAGIGLVIGRYKVINSLGGKIEMMNITDNLKRVFEMSGILKLVPIIDSFEYEKIS